MRSRVKARHALTLFVVLLASCGTPSNEVLPRDASPPQDQSIAEAEFKSPSFGWALRRDALYITSNRGQSWKRVPVPAGAESARSAALRDSTHAWLAAISDLDVRIYSTADQGKAWHTATLTPTSQPGNAVLSARDGVQGLLVEHQTSSNFSSADFFSSMDGSTWQRHQAPIAGTFALASASVVLLAGGPAHDQLWRSANLGATWTRVDVEGLSIGTFTLGTPVMTDASNGLLPVTLNDDAASRALFYITSDGGKSWARRGSVDVQASTGSGASIPTTVSEDGSTWFAVAPSGSRIYVSTDKGGTFEVKSPNGLPAGIVELSFADGKNGWARTSTGFCAGDKTSCASAEALFATADGGQTWNQLSVTS
jgi:photosystem II stability/assembly factor-like uncharacterized protein